MIIVSQRSQSDIPTVSEVARKLGSRASSGAETAHEFPIATGIRLLVSNL